MKLTITEAELCEAVESYWGKIKTGHKIEVTRYTKCDVSTSGDELVFDFDYEDVNP